MLAKSTPSPLSATALSILDFFAAAHAMGPCLAPHTEPKIYGIQEPDMEMMQSIELVSIRIRRTLLSNSSFSTATILQFGNNNLHSNLDSIMVIRALQFVLLFATTSLAILEPYPAPVSDWMTQTSFPISSIKVVPSDGAKLDSNPPSFWWTGADTGPKTTYRLDIWSVNQTWSFKDLANNYFTVPFEIPTNTTYSWRVIKNKAGVNVTSVNRTFEVLYDFASKVSVSACPRLLPSGNSRTKFLASPSGIGFPTRIKNEEFYFIRMNNATLMPDSNLTSASFPPGSPEWAAFLSKTANDISALTLAIYNFSWSLWFNPSNLVHFTELRRRVLSIASYNVTGMTGTASQDQANRDIMLSLSMAYDVIKQNLTEAERTLVVNTIRARGMQVYNNGAEIKILGVQTVGVGFGDSGEMDATVYKAIICGSLIARVLADTSSILTQSQKNLYLWYCDRLNTNAMLDDRYNGHIWAAPFPSIPQLTDVAMKAAGYAPSIHLKQIGWVAMHSTLFSPNRTSLYFRAAPLGSGNHNNADQLAFTLSHRNQSFLIASGYYDYYGSAQHYNWRKQTKAQSGQTINSFFASGSIRQWYTSNEYDAVTGTAVNAYNDGYGTKQVTRATRSIIYFRGTNQYIIQDQFDSPVPQSWSWNFHAYKNMTLLGPGRVLIPAPAGNATVCLRVLNPDNLVFTQTNLFPANAQTTLPNQFHAKWQVWSPTKTFALVVVIDPDCTNATVPGEASIVSTRSVPLPNGTFLKFDGDFLNVTSTATKMSEEFLNEWQ
ncbi:hypothetical protein HDU79_011015 [Rhizoclosmatium sp. JEL0117]|nr:hypothetical protein HDU79_011015 [Rhizoclosmatium sp. JEL0117]